ncbi:MAG TPA: RnfABCDGE type electron transport complex subunit G [Bacillota bacterium]|nr:RnfABCDGE type electron transport complex subunit G [Bacillota bacterium]
MRDYLRLMIVLAAIGAVAAGLLALVDSFTEPKIQAFKIQAESAAYQQALPQAKSFKDDEGLLETVKSNPNLSDITGLKVGYDGDQPAGWVCKVSPRGYSSNIEMLVGIKPDGQLAKVVILSQSETPGLGTNIVNPEFIEQPAIYNSKGQDLKVTKDGGKVDAVTGATISSRAVLRGINQVFGFYRLQVPESGGGSQQ